MDMQRIFAHFTDPDYGLVKLVIGIIIIIHAGKMMVTIAFYDKTCSTLPSPLLR